MKEKSLRGLLVGTIVLVLLITLIGTKSINNTYAIDTNEKNNILDKNDFQFTIEDFRNYEPGDKVYINLKFNHSKYENTALVGFTRTDDEFGGFAVYLKDIDSNPYFIVPDEVQYSGTYKFSQVILYNIGELYGDGVIYYPDPNTNSENTNIKIDVSNKVEKELSELSLNKFYLRDSGVFLNENIGVRVDYNGNPSSICVNAVSKDGTINLGYSCIVNIDSPDASFSEEANGIPGDYEIKSIEMCYNYINCKTFYQNADGSSLGEFTIFDSKDKSLKLVAINLNTLNAEPGDKVYVDVNANKDISSALLVFYDSYNKKTFSAYVKNIKGHGYFMLPSTVESGGYRLQNVIIKDNDGNTQVTNVPDFAAPSYTDDNGVFYETIEMFVQEKAEENKDSLVFNNEEYDDLINKKIESLSDTGVITVICDNAPLVRSTLFKKIAETRKTLILQYGDSEWVFNGTDIVDPKYIDVSMLISSIKNSSEFGNSNISNLISEEDTSVLSFANNGTLPGKALIRLNSTELDSKFGNKDIFVYYYNTEENKLFKIALEVQKIEGYYEFYINHNSDYVLSTKELEGDYVVEDKELLNLNSTIDIKVSDVFSSTKATIIALVCVVLIAVIAVVSLLHVVKHGKYVEKKDNKVNKKGKK